jgi:membrane protein CcdC involved in cytochrome C biogenesis
MVHAFRLAYLSAPVVGGLAVLVWRIQETRTPVTAKKILIPPLGMSTGFFMFVAPAMRVPWAWAISAYLVGALLLSYPLARTSSLERSGDVILMRRSNGFLLILLALLVLRLALHPYVGSIMPAKQTAAVFYLLAFGMISRWRAGMYLQYRALTSAQAVPVPDVQSQEASA